MSAKYSKVQGYYAAGLWSKNQVRNAVVKGWITEDEYAEITGEDYV
ncbi:MAG: XkdX family protein [Clostridiales bacterium]|nr:XkdX family protein [Clostridiales bacterium]